MGPGRSRELSGGSVQHLIGGNVNLDPESSDTYSYGFILNPNFLENVTLTVDYYDIKVEKAITSVNGETTLTACIDGNDAACCGLFTATLPRAIRCGSATRGQPNGVDALFINSGFFQVKGIDTELHSTWDLGNRWGSLDVSDQLAYVEFVEATGIAGHHRRELRGSLRRIVRDAAAANIATAFPRRGRHRGT